PDDASALLRARSLLAGRRHELVEVLLGDAEPEDVLVPELLPRLIDLLELRISLRETVVDLLGGLVARLHDLPRKRPELDARGNETAQGRRGQSIVLGHHVDVGFGAGRFPNALVVLWALLLRLCVD